jgi:hypothetical protein
LVAATMVATDFRQKTESELTKAGLDAPFRNAVAHYP